MEMNENFDSMKWNEMKGEVKKAWSRLTDEELEKTKGDEDAIGELIEQRYGVARENYGARLAEIVRRYETEESAADKTSSSRAQVATDDRDSMQN